MCTPTEAEPPSIRRTRSATSLAALLFGLSALPIDAGAQQVRIMVQSSPIAGFRHYDAPALWGEIKEGDALTLVRERTNPHDPNAVRVEWGSHRLGYVPRTENEAVARQLDNGVALRARVSRLQKTRAPNRRIELEVYLPL